MSYLPFHELGVMGSKLVHLKRLTFNYNRKLVAHDGIRLFLNNHLIDFAKKYPSVAIYIKVNEGMGRVEAEYLSGSKTKVKLANKSLDEIFYEMWKIKSNSGIKVSRIVRYWNTRKPSIQGNWHPFLFPFPDNSAFIKKEVICGVHAS